LVGSKNNETTDERVHAVVCDYYNSLPKDWQVDSKVVKP